MRILTSTILLVLHAAVAHAQAGAGDFHYVQQSDALTDEDRSMVFTTALNATLTREGVLVWRCNGGELELLLNADEYLGDDLRIPVQWRFDDRAPEDRTFWHASTNNRAAFAPDDQIRAFTSAALPSSEVVIRVWGYDEHRYTYRFSLMGLTRSLQRLPCADG